MALETATYISGLVAANPLSTDPKSQGDDHLRLIKSVLLNTLPNITGAVTATHTELNYVAGVTSGIQTQLNTITAQLAAGTSASLNSITAATGSSTIDNGSNQVNWNWTLGATSGHGLSISESTATATNVAAKALLNVSTIPGSYANALRVNVAGNSTDSIKVNYYGALSLNSVTTGASGSPLSIAASNGITTYAGGNVTINAGSGTGTGAGGSVQIAAGNSVSGTNGGEITLTAGSGSASGGDITLRPSATGTTVGRVNFVNSNVANGTVASAFTASVGPTGAGTSIAGWLAIKVAGTQRYIPYW